MAIVHDFTGKVFQLDDLKHQIGFKLREDRLTDAGFSPEELVNNVHFLPCTFTIKHEWQNTNFDSTIRGFLIRYDVDTKSKKVPNEFLFIKRFVKSQDEPCLAYQTNENKGKYSQYFFVPKGIGEQLKLKIPRVAMVAQGFIRQ